MTKWPEFVTRDLDLEKDEDNAEMIRRWEQYDRDMRALTATGKFHQDDEGWWIETATGEKVGPDPEIERPLDQRPSMKLDEALPELAEAIKRPRGRPRVDNPKEPVTLRLDPETVKRFKARGSTWRADMAEALDKASRAEG